jgi:hypothetical protein
MTEKITTLNEVFALVDDLSPLDKVRLMEKIATSLKVNIREEFQQPIESMYGICADLGTAPSAEDIDEVRREIWANFPREGNR